MAEGVGAALALFQTFGSIVSSIETRFTDMDINSDAAVDCFMGTKYLSSKIDKLRSKFNRNRSLQEDEDPELLLQRINELLGYVDAKLEEISKKKQV